MSDDELFKAVCTGTLKADNLSISIAFELACSREGDIALRIGDVPLTAETSHLLGFLTDAAGDGPRLLQLIGSDTAGGVVTSETVYLTTLGTRTDERGSWVTVEAAAVWLDVRDREFDSKATAVGIRVAYHVPGLRGFGAHQVETRAGHLSFFANASIENYDEISGRLDLEARSSAASILDWVATADEVALEMLDIVSFAEGRFIRWSVRELFVGTKVAEIAFHGPRRSHGPRRGFYHWLDIQPVLELAASNYTPELKAKTGIDIALEWSLMNPSYLELEFLACFTALEHLSSVYEGNSKKAKPNDRAYFDSVIEPGLVETLKQFRRSASDSESLAIDKALGKLRDLKRATAQDAIAQMLEGYGVPLWGLDGVLPGLIKLRNSIVHKGVATGPLQLKLQRHVVIARELLTRVFLTLLEYRGRYNSYLNGDQFVLFPPDPDGSAPRD